MSDERADAIPDNLVELALKAGGWPRSEWGRGKMAASLAAVAPHMAGGGEAERLREIERLADSFDWPCRRHRPEGCEDCTACRLHRALGREWPRAAQQDADKAEP